MKKLVCKIQLVAKTFILSFFIFHFSSCSVSDRIAKSADKILLKDSSISTGHIGISIYEPATNSYWYNYDAAKYFVPASNTKLFTCYAGMKYLGDSLMGLKYYDTDSAVYVEPTGDPTFLHEDFKTQAVLDFLKNQKRNIYITTDNWKDEALGKGWPWDDYNDSYMSERSPMPVFGNVVKFELDTLQLLKIYPAVIVSPDYFTGFTGILQLQRFFQASFLNRMPSLVYFTLKRNQPVNHFYALESKNKFTEQKIPFITSSIDTTIAILKKDYKINISRGDNSKFAIQNSKLIHSQPTDSLLKPMMHRSDNFFAEQTLLMVSNEHLGYMNDEDIIDTLLNTDLKDVPQKPKWVDGSGLSRYNLFTPQSFVYILNKMKNEFGLKRLEVILPTGGEGTLKNYYVQDSSFIYAKTGSLSNNFSLSGFLITKKNKLLIFSILVNNFQNDAAPVRVAIQQFIENIRDKY